MAESKRFWLPFFIGLSATVAAALILILLLSVFRENPGDGPRAAARLFLARLARGEVNPAPGRRPTAELKRRWAAVARSGVLDRTLQAGGRAAVYVVVPAGAMPGVDLASLKRRLTALQKKLAPAVGAAARVDLIGRAGREAARGRLLFFIRLFRAGKTWRVEYPQGLVIVGGR